MKFIFPQNYNLKNKLFGIIDYSSLFVNIIWDLFIFCLINLIFKENSNVKIIAIKLCTNNNDKNVRSQDLKNQELDTVVRDNNAKGESSTNIFTSIYLIEYENSKLTNPNEKKLSNIPFKEKKLKSSNVLM